jgi:hypothetical protein
VVHQKHLNAPFLGAKSSLPSIILFNHWWTQHLELSRFIASNNGQDFNCMNRRRQDHQQTGIQTHLIV